MLSCVFSESFAYYCTNKHLILFTDQSVRRGSYRGVLDASIWHLVPHIEPKSMSSHSRHSSRGLRCKTDDQICRLPTSPIVH